MRKLVNGKELSVHEQEALKSLSKDILITVGSVAVTGGLAHGLTLALSHVGYDAVKDSILKAFAHGIVESSVLAAKGDDSDDKMMEKVIEELAKFIENGEIPDASWEHAISELAKANKTKPQTKKT